MSTVITVDGHGLETGRATDIDPTDPYLPQADFIRTIDPVSGRDDAKRVIEAWLDTDADLTPDLLQTAYDYDQAGHLVAQGGLGFVGTGTSGATYTYDVSESASTGASGLKTAETLNLTPVGSAGAISASYEYDAASDSRLKQATMDLYGDSANEVTETYTFDKAGNLQTVADGTHTYNYVYECDGQPPLDSNRLVSIEKDGVAQTHFTFDAEGRWRTMQAPTSAPDDPNRELFTYTDAGRLATYKKFAAGSPVTEATYTYDPAGQRSRSVVTEGTGEDAVTTTTDYTYTGLTLRELRASETQGGTQKAGWSITYLYDEAGKPYAGVYRDDELTTPELFNLVTTDRGDVVSLTDKYGAPFAAYRYDAWGRPVGQGNVGTGTWAQPTTDDQQNEVISQALATKISGRQVLRYAGYCYDQESGLYYLSARHYDPSTRQFLSKDLSRNDGEQSAYQYCGGNPVGFTDSTGLYKETVGTIFGSVLYGLSKKTNSATLIGLSSRYLARQQSAAMGRQELLQRREAVAKYLRQWQAGGGALGNDGGVVDMDSILIGEVNSISYIHGELRGMIAQDIGVGMYDRSMFYCGPEGRKKGYGFDGYALLLDGGVLTSQREFEELHAKPIPYEGCDYSPVAIRADHGTWYWGSQLNPGAWASKSASAFVTTFDTAAIVGLGMPTLGAPTAITGAVWGLGGADWVSGLVGGTTPISSAFMDQWGSVLTPYNGPTWWDAPQSEDW